MTAGLRITHLVETLERGGLERVVVDLALEQRTRGADVEVLCLFVEGVLAAELRAGGIAVHALGKRAGLDLGVLSRLRGRLRAHATGLLHTHNAVAHYYGVAAALGLPGLGIVNTRHGMGNAPFRRRREWLYRLALRRTAAAALVCESARRGFVGHGIVPAGKARVVRNGIRAAPAGTRAQALAALGLAEAPFRVGTVGRLNPVKDQATLLRALALLRGNLPGAELVLVGGGALRDSLEALAKELGIAGAVHFCGDRADARALLPAFDVFALTSLSEGYSIALLEACDAGLPIVATAVGGNAEIVADGVNGLLVAPGDPESLAAALAELAEKVDWRRGLGRAGREWVGREGTIATMAGHYDELYRHART